MPDPADSDAILVNVASHLRRAAQARPFKRAVVCPCGRDRIGRVAYAPLTFQQLDRASDRLAPGLQLAGRHLSDEPVDGGCGGALVRGYGADDSARA